MSLALLFPPTCLACRELLDEPSPSELCQRCGRGHTLLPRWANPSASSPIHALFDYDGPLGPVLGQLKFQGDLALAGPLGRLLAEHPHLCCDPQGRVWDAVVPVPLHPSRLWSRGFNQSLLLARWALWHVQHQGRSAPRLRADLLRRSRSTVPQSELDATSRQTNVHAAFHVPGHLAAEIEGRRILVVDDVTTTGATFVACFQALHEAGAVCTGGLSLLRTLS